MTVSSYIRGLARFMTCLAMLVMGTAAAQTSRELATDEAEQPPVFEVEFLVFAYNQFNPLEEEFAPSKPKWPRPLADIRLTATPETLPPSSADWYLDSLTLPGVLEPTTLPAAGEAVGGDDTGRTPPGTETPQLDEAGNSFGTPSATVEESGTWYRLLEADELELDRARARLATLDAYTPLLHGGWSQAALLEEQAIPFELGVFGRLQPAGSIRLHRSRFLHLTIDVSIQDDYRYRQAPIAPNAVWPLAEFYRPTRYTIETQRRIRSGELHFFDHPAFGILVIVRPAPEAPEAGETVDPGPAA